MVRSHYAGGTPFLRQRKHELLFTFETRTSHKTTFTDVPVGRTLQPKLGACSTFQRVDTDLEQGQHA